MENDPRRVARPRARRRSLRRNLLSFAAAMLVIPCLMVVAGFFVFVTALPQEEPVLDRKAQGMVALTGGADRISDAVDLLASGHAEKLLITGVNQTTTAPEIARLTPQFSHLFSCCIELGRQAQNTIGNAAETRRWVRQHGMRSLIVVTSNYHMPRALVELGNALPGTELLPYPVITERQKSGPLWANGGMLRVLVVEYVKYLLAVARTRLSTGSADDGLVHAASRSP